MAGSGFLDTIPATLEVHREPRRPVTDPTLGVGLTVDRQGTPRNRLVTVGDSLTQGFMSGAVFRTDLSWPAVVAFELGLRLGTDFRYPVYEQPQGPGGLPLDLERLARHFETRFGSSLDWSEVVRAGLWLRSYMDGVEDYWEGDPSRHLVDTAAPYHNLAVYGWDLLDAQWLDADRARDRIPTRRSDHAFAQIVEEHGALAALLVLESCRAPDGTPGTVLDAARAMGEEGTDHANRFGIETLCVMLGGNNALGSVLSLAPRWTPDNYLDLAPTQRVEAKGSCSVWQPHHFAAEWHDLVQALKAIKARHVIVATVPQVTIAPIARGVLGKQRMGSRYFTYYTRPWITDADFDPDRDPRITGDEARVIDSAIDAYNETIIESVRSARQLGLDWYLFDLGGTLDRLAARRYVEDPAARPVWWTPYELPAELANLQPVPDTRFFRAGPDGRTQGGIFSLDGIHATTSGYGLVAQEILTIMDRHAGVAFASPDGHPRPAGVSVDFSRVLASDSLLRRPPAAISSTLSLLGWLDDAVDWVRHIVPFL